MLHESVNDYLILHLDQKFLPQRQFINQFSYCIISKKNFLYRGRFGNAHTCCQDARDLRNDTQSPLTEKHHLSLAIETLASTQICIVSLIEQHGK